MSISTRRSRVNETATPEFKAHEREYGIARVNGTGTVKLYQAPHGERIEKSATPQHRSVQRVIHFGTQLLT
jgi:hypothetical protein